MMDLELTDEHEMLRESAASFVAKEHSFGRLRALKNDPLGYSRDVWKKMADLGWTGLIFPEAYGGFGLDFGFVMVLMEEFGRGLLPEPWISNVLCAGNMVALGGSEAQKGEILPRMASGDRWMTVAYLEDQGRYDLDFCTTSARWENGAFSISGKKIFVMDGCAADWFIVSARTSGAVRDTEGISLFEIPRNADGVKVIPLKTLDRRNACNLELRNVSVPERALIGDLNGGHALLVDTIDQATAGLCAEMMGGMDAALDLTVAYLSERVQFGRPIGSFQALQHKAADMFIQKELASSAVYYAIASIDGKTPECSSSVSLAKAKCSTAYMELTKTAIQLFGAIGFTNEADIGLYLRRAKVAEILFGDTEYHLDRYATLKRY